jgi:hypothetical protein
MPMTPMPKECAKAEVLSFLYENTVQRAVMMTAANLRNVNGHQPLAAGACCLANPSRFSILATAMRCAANTGRWFASRCEQKF